DFHVTGVQTCALPICLPAGVHFARLSARPVIGAARVAFQSDLDGPGVNATNNSGIWSGLPGAFRLVARTGSPAPGADGAVFASRSEERRVGKECRGRV